VAGAARLQAALGYRFVLESVAYTRSVRGGSRLVVELVVRNAGSAPFYYRWPVEVSLLDERDRRVVWRDVFTAADVREWQPGRSKLSPAWTAPTEGEPAKANWPAEEITDWSEPPASNQVRGEFSPSVPPGRYVLALAILDPAGMRPVVCFATTQYWRGGRHPIGLVGFGGAEGGTLPDAMTFDDQFSDQTLRYELGADPQPLSNSGEK